MSTDSAGPATERLERLGKGVEVGKTLFALLRDLAILVVLVLLVAAPTLMRERLHKAGFVSGKILGLEWLAEAKQNNLKVDTRVQRAVRFAQSASDQLKQLAESDPVLAARLRPARMSLAQAENSLGRASSELGFALREQQRALQQAGQPTAPLRGWVSTSPGVAEVPRPVAVGARLIVRERNLRVRSAPGVESQVLGVLPARSEAEVVRLGPGPWAEVVQR